jgi:hypothetical protein
MPNVEMWLNLLMLEGEERVTRRAGVVERLSLSRTDGGLGCRFATGHPVGMYADAVISAIPRVGGYLQKAGVPLDEMVWRALGVHEWHGSGEWTQEEMQKAARDIAEKERERLREAEARVAECVRKGRCGPWLDGTTTNLVVEWVTMPTPTPASLATKDALILIRRLFGLPITGRTGVPPPRSCRKCGATISYFGGGVDIRAKPRSAVDDGGEHALTCALSAG